MRPSPSLCYLYQPVYNDLFKFVKCCWTGFLCEMTDPRQSKGCDLTHVFQVHSHSAILRPPLTESTYVSSEKQSTNNLTTDFQHNTGFQQSL